MIPFSQFEGVSEFEIALPLGIFDATIIESTSGFTRGICRYTDIMVSMGGIRKQLYNGSRFRRRGRGKNESNTYFTCAMCIGSTV